MVGCIHNQKTLAYKMRPSQKLSRRNFALSSFSFLTAKSGSKSYFFLLLVVVVVVVVVGLVVVVVVGTYSVFSFNSRIGY